MTHLPLVAVAVHQGWGSVTCSGFEGSAAQVVVDVLGGNHADGLCWTEETDLSACEGATVLRPDVSVALLDWLPV